jgi:hypothetical protein
VTVRTFSLVAALVLVPAMARSEAAAEPAAAAAPADQQTGSTTPGSSGSVVIPPKVQERTDFQLSLTTLEALRKKGAITEAEYNAALRDLVSVGQRASSSPTFVVGRFVTTLYGYLEGDVIHDSQRVTTDGYGGSPSLNLPGTFLGDNGRTVFSSRGTRLGMRFAAPEVSGIRVRANFEMDFVGNQPGTPVTAPPATGRTITETNFFVNATPRIRIALAQVDTDYLTLSIGQTWNLMAFEAAYLPTSIQPQGLPGQLFGRNPQVRLSHIFDAKVISVEAAAAALRSPQFDSEMPDLQGGLKFNISGWTGVQSIGSTGTVISPASIAVTGATRKIKMATVVSGANASKYESVSGNVIALNAFVPVIPATQRGPFALSLLGEAATGTGMSDLYSGLSGGAAIGRPPAPGVPAAPAAPAADPYAGFVDIDAGIAGFNRSGKLDTVDFRTLIVGAQLSLGSVVLAGNYSNVYSDNVQQFNGAWNQQAWWDANLIVDPWSGVRFGLEFARTLQRRTNNQLGNNSRVFFGTFFLF